MNSTLQNLGAAPELAGISGWINSVPTNISSQRGKVVLIDFWTYSCINCIRTLPYLEEWHEKYPELVIIGVHTPEFEFEKDYNNVKSAVEKYGLKYAIAQDNDRETWKAFGNLYWPRKYLIDREGNIRYDHIGEGSYEETEKAIQSLLGVSREMSNVSSVDFSGIGTPELYLGYLFARAPLGNPEGFQPGNVVNYRIANITRANTIYLSGVWKNEQDRMVAYGPSRLFLVYKAKNVNIVAGGNSTIDVFVDGVPSNGVDVKDGSGSISSHRLYNIAEGNDYEVHTLEIDAEPGFELYTFTFG
ncbi:MAG: thiol-disulfide isomerase [archaeon GW2011_AR5]|nr:MAG: thiol-disulfide isomerase [archaeon GW2011_AR5]